MSDASDADDLIAGINAEPHGNLADVFSAPRLT